MKFAAVSTHEATGGKDPTGMHGIRNRRKGSRRL